MSNDSQLPNWNTPDEPIQVDTVVQPAENFTPENSDLTLPEPQIQIELQPNKGKEKLGDSDVSLDLDLFGFIIPAGANPSVKADPILVRKREKKWKEMTDHWDKWKSRSKLRNRIKKGVPESYRGLCWKLILGIPEKIKNNEGLYQRLLNSPVDAQVINDIVVDLPRTFPDHFLFKYANGPGQKELYNVLKAYACKNPELGYCQGMSGVAAVFLMYCTPEEAFFMLDTVLETHMKGYYSSGLTQLKQDSAIFDWLLLTKNKQIHTYLKSKGIDVILYTTKWFMTVFTQCLYWETVVRIWDVFLLKGTRFLIRVGLAILKLYTSDILKKKQLEVLLPFLLEPPVEKIRPAVLLPVALKIKFKDKELYKLRTKIFAK